MARTALAVGLVLVAVTMLWPGTAAQSSCTSVIISMSPCLNYISGNSSTPSSGCCTQLASVVRSQPQCLCEVLNGGGSSVGININQTQALALPGACNVQTPPLSRCNGNGKNAHEKLRIEFTWYFLRKLLHIQNVSYTILTSSICNLAAASPADSPAAMPESPTTVPSGTYKPLHKDVNLGG